MYSRKYMKTLKVKAASNIGVFSIEGEDQNLLLSPPDLNSLLLAIDRASKKGKVNLQSVKKELSTNAAIDAEITTKKESDPAIQVTYTDAGNKLNIKDAKGPREMTVKDLNSKVSNLHKRSEDSLDTFVDQKFSDFRLDLEKYAFSKWSELMEEIKSEVMDKVESGSITQNDYAPKLKKNLELHYGNVEDIIEWKKLRYDINEVLKEVEDYEPDYQEEETLI